MRCLVVQRTERSPGRDPQVGTSFDHCERCLVECWRLGKASLFEGPPSVHLDVGAGREFAVDAGVIQRQRCHRAGVGGCSKANQGHVVHEDGPRLVTFREGDGGNLAYMGLLLVGVEGLTVAGVRQAVHDRKR